MPHNVTRMLQRLVALYDELKEEMGQGHKLEEVGSLSFKSRLKKFKRSVSAERSSGMGVLTRTVLKSVQYVISMTDIWREHRKVHRNEHLNNPLILTSGRQQ